MTMAGPAMDVRLAGVAAVLSRRVRRRPEVGLVLGTGLGRLTAEMTDPVAVPYGDLPGFPVSTVASHAGQMVFGILGGRPVVALQGRWHGYEGYPLAEVAFPVRVLAAAGVTTLIVSNACGGLKPEMTVGDLMVISDHLNLLGDSPLRGSGDAIGSGARFTDLSAAYDPALRALARRIAARRRFRLHEGTYAAVLGPNLETPAEYRMLRVMGADAVGMSTVPEVIVARQCGLRVLGISVITDLCLPDALEPVDLARIIAAAERAEPALTALVTDVLQELPA